MHRSVSIRAAVSVVLALSYVSSAAAQRKGGGGGAAASRGSARQSVNRSGSSNAAANRNTNSNRNTNTNVNRNTNINQDVNINVDRDVDVHAYGGYYGGGCCYHPVAAAMAVTATAIAIGSIVASIPPSCTAVVVNGLTYQQCGSTWYQPQFVGSTTQYIVVEAPH